ncbi:osmoprotectant transport system permease protein [Tamaricihabitans halophyticus]|uniref:Osmoprotectant transport system permease protein n=1 Tax=Tamaricihabitans halophyticus TaxID=1262583 RepID=A0A4R2QK41_9PSEU|nr:ABC transporter permease subunit [Tamaricihabitans halophyticus]TCP49189.1 osmoprotectant transport system permease protein [Tamaricihabitans halophyticus]
MLGDLISWFGDGANWRGSGGIPAQLLAHVEFTLISLLIAAAIAIPLGLFVGHSGRGGVLLVGASNAIRSLPTLGLVTFLFLLISGAEAAAIIGLVVLAIPPILAGTYAGVSEADRVVVDAAVGMGMTGRQRLWQVEVPVALPLIMGGIRNAVLQLVATVAVAAYVGLDGLGRFLLDGLKILDYSAVAGGALLTALLAVLLDLVFALLSRIVVPQGLRVAARGAAAGGTHP